MASRWPPTGDAELQLGHRGPRLVDLEFHPGHVFLLAPLLTVHGGAKNGDLNAPAGAGCLAGAHRNSDVERDARLFCYARRERLYSLRPPGGAWTFASAIPFSMSISDFVTKAASSTISYSGSFSRASRALLRQLGHGRVENSPDLTDFPQYVRLPLVRGSGMWASWSPSAPTRTSMFHLLGGISDADRPRSAAGRAG